MEDGKTQENKQFILNCFKTNTPIFIITKDDDWVRGYLNEVPKDLFCIILDRDKNIPKQVFYSKVHKVFVYEGNLSKLPLPPYLSLDGSGITNTEQSNSVNTTGNASFLHPDFQDQKREDKNDFREF